MPNLAFRSLALAIKALTEPWEQAHGYKRALVAVERTTTFDQDEEPTIAFDITSHPPRRTAPAALQNWPAATWGGSGSRHHWVRDACMREDKTRSQDDNLDCHLSALRVCRVALKADLHPEPSWPQLQERCQHESQIPFQALVKHRAE